VDSAADAEHYARPGDVILTVGTVELLRAAVQLEQAGPYARLLAITDELPPPVAVVLPTIDAALAARFFPTSLLHQAFSGEFRQVTYLFVRLPAVHTEAQLARFMQTIFVLQDRFGVLLKLQFGDKGVHLLLIWGASSKCACWPRCSGMTPGGRRWMDSCSRLG
jgi:hypothetical protein